MMSSLFVDQPWLGWISLAIAAPVVLTTFVVPVLSFVYRFAIRGKVPLARTYGKWAVVTGATDGIGKAYAVELAKQGLNILLVSRTASRLAEVQTELQTKFPSVTVQTLVIDFSTLAPATSAWQSLQSTLQSIEVGVLINNVGVSYDHPEYFHELSIDAVQQLITMNVSSTTLMTRLVLPQMVQRKRGAIVSISSFSSLVPSALLAEYGAAKSYVNTFMNNLAVEYGHVKNLHFSSQCPLYVTSKLSKIRHASITTPNPATYAAAGVRSIGYESIAQPYWVHAIAQGVVSLLPESLVASVVLGQHVSIRKRALKKKAGAGADAAASGADVKKD